MIFLISPYADKSLHVRNDRAWCALRAASALMEAGEPVYSPVVYLHWMQQKVDVTYSPTIWSRLSLNMLHNAHRCYVLTIPGWNCPEVGTLVTNAIALGRPIQGYAFGKEAEDVSGHDIMGEFGFKIEGRVPVFRLVRDKQED